MNQDINEQCSIKDKQMKAVLYLKESSARMHDLAEELNRMHDVMRDNELSNRTKNSQLITLKYTIIPFVHDTFEQIFNHSKILSPIVGLDYVHEREECKKRNNQLKLQNLIEINIEYEKRILNIISEKGIEDLDIRNATLEMFQKCNKDQLSSFILARKTNILKSKVQKKVNYAML